MAVRLINPAPRHFDNSGRVLSNGVIQYFEPLTTTVKQASVTLDSSGLEPDTDVDGPCRVRLLDKNGVQLWSRDNANESETPPFSLWSAFETYVIGDLVSGDDGLFYRSRLPENFNNDPGTSPLAWEPVFFIAGSADSIDSMAQILPPNNALILGSGTEWAGASLGDLTRNYLAGLQLSNAADADHDITVSAGRCSDSTNTISMAVGQITKRIDATWASGTENGGLASGATLSNSTWYHVFVVRVGQITDVMFDSSVICANGVANNAVTHFRRIGSVYADGSANIAPFTQVGDRFYWSTPTGSGFGLTSALRAVRVPPGIKVTAMLYAFLAHATTGAPEQPEIYIGFSDPDTPYVAPTASTCDAIIRPFESGTRDQEVINIGAMAQTNTQAQVNYGFSPLLNTAITTFLTVVGWIDKRGQD